MKLYEVKALAHETQSRIRQDLNAWNDFLEHASRVYRYRFMDQILIYAQRPDAVACATMNIWNSKMGCWIKKGNRGIALIDESNSRKLKYVYDDKKEGGAALIAAAKESKTPERTMIGDYKGFKLYSRFDAFFNLYYIHMQGRCEHTIEMSSDPAGMITRLNNCMAGFEKRLSDVQDALDETRIELETAEKEVTKKFDKEDILSEKLKRLSFLNAQLDADRKETPQNAPQNTQAQKNDKEKYIKI